MAKFPGSLPRASVKAPTRVHVELRFNDRAGTYEVPLLPGTFVTDIGWYVTTAFTTSGSNAALTIGDTVAADNYADASDTALQTLDTVLARASGAGETNATGQYYPEGGAIRFHFTPATAGATAGVLKAYVELSVVTNDGIDPAA